MDSKTTFPELIGNQTFYDFPSFSDAKSASHGGSITSFIKKALDKAEKVKTVFIVSYPSVRKEVDRQDFMELDKFKNSTARILTKVDEVIIETIADFIQEITEESRLTRF